MPLSNEMILHDRLHAHLLAEKLAKHARSGAIVVGAGASSATLAVFLANELNLVLELVLLRTIYHPSDHTRIIGYVSGERVMLNDNGFDIPQNYLFNHASQLQYELKDEYRYLFGDREKPVLNNKTVIMVDDLLDTFDSTFEVLESLRAQKPAQIIAAIPVVAARAVDMIAPKVDDIVFLHKISGDLGNENLYASCPMVDLSEVKDLWMDAASHLN